MPRRRRAGHPPPFRRADAARGARARHPPDVASVTVSPVSFPVLSQRTVDVSRSLPDLSARPRLSNVAYQDADTNGRIKVSFDVNTRYTLVGRPEERGIAEVLAYIVS